MKTRYLLLASLLTTSLVVAQDTAVYERADGGGGGSTAADITSGTTTITGGTDTALCFDDGGVINCNDAGGTFNKTTDRIRAAGGVNASAGGYIVEIANDGSTGTVANKLVTLTATGAAIRTSTTDTDGIVGVCVDSCGTTGSAKVLLVGKASCDFDSATTADHFVGNDGSTNGDCTDLGATITGTAAVVGQVMTTNGGAGTYDVLFNLPTITSVTNIKGGGGGKSPEIREFVFMLGADNGSVLVDGDDQATIFWNRMGSTATITEVGCESDGGTPSINLQRDDGSAANILSSNLSCSTSGATTTSFSGSEASIANDNKIDLVMVAAGGVAKRITLTVKYTF